MAGGQQPHSRVSVLLVVAAKATGLELGRRYCARYVICIAAISLRSDADADGSLVIAARQLMPTQSPRVLEFHDTRRSIDVLPASRLRKDQWC
jgi:hypothetical protein